jgi:cytochrome P450
VSDTTTAETSDDVYYDPYDEAINADPYPTFERLREEAPLYYNGKYDVWALSRHEDVEAAIKDWETFSNSRSDILEIIQSGMEMPSGVVLFEDPPVHTMHRKLMSRVFTPRRMAELEDQVRDYCAACLDPLVGGDRIDFMTDLGVRMPMQVIGMLLGIPTSEQDAVRERSDAFLRTESGKPMEVQQDAIANGEMYREYIEWRMEHPSDDLMTTLLNAEFDDTDGNRRRLSIDEVLTYTQVLAGAGNETTGRLIGWMGKVLAEHPDQRRDMVDDPGLVPAAVEEILRFEPTGPHLARWVARDYTNHGRTVPAGSAMLLLVGSANRDPRRHENPDSFDIHRADPSHLTFGFGLHYCLGANLARLEARVATEEILKRFPEWEIDYGQLRMAPTSTVRGWESMPARLPTN